ncbi:MAG: amino acid adenylation domain-containing protein, partial [Planctomycetota bacterium]
PFDLEAGPLLRARLLHLDEDDHVLLLTLHHIVADGWSKGILTREVTDAYRAFVAGRTPETPPLPLQYADYAAWQHEALRGPALARLEAFWRDALDGMPPVLELPTDRPRPAEQTTAGASHFVTLSPATASALRDLAGDAGGSLFMALLALTDLFLYRLTGRADMAVGTNVANREHADLEGLIGFFVNTLVLRTDLGGEPSFRDLLRRTTATALDAFAHQALPFERLVEILQPERSLAHTPLVQAAIVLQNASAGRVELPGLTIEALPADRASAKFDLSFIYTPTTDGLLLEIEYRTDLFDAATIERYGRILRTLAAAAIEDPDTGIDRLPLLDATERAAVLRLGHGQPHTPTSGETLPDRFRAVAARTPDAPAVADGTVTFAYRELDAASDRLAARLQAEGVAAGEAVGICMARSAHLAVGLLGILKAGAAYLPLDPDAPDARLCFQADDADLRVVLSDGPACEALSARFGDAAALCLPVDDPALHADTAPLPPHVALAPDALAYIIYTSGSTGEPKGTLIEHRSILQLVDGLHGLVYRDLAAPVRVALLASVVFDASVQQIFAALLGGHCLQIVDEATRADGEALADCFAANGVTVADGTPSLLGLLAQSRFFDRTDLPLRQWLIGGEALPRALVERVAATPVGRNLSILNVYGPTECCVDATAYRIDPAALSPTAIVPIGRPLPGVRIIVTDAYGAPVPVGVPGEIRIAGGGVGRGYLRREALTGERFAPLPAADEPRAYRTGDRGRWRSDGTLEFLGRLDEQVKIRGHRIEPGEIEAALCTHPAIAEAAVVADGDASGTRELVAYLVGDGTLTADACRDHLAERLPAALIPAAFVRLDRLPLNASGKLDRHRLPAPDGADRLATEAAYRAPQTPVETALAAAWRAVLRAGRIGLDDNYFSLGGDSIKALQIASRLREAGWGLTVRDLFQHQTVGALAPHLQPLTDDHAAADTGGGTAPLTGIQQWFLQAFRGRADHYNQSILLVPRDRLDPDALRRAWRAVVGRHDALRLAFRRDGEAGLQSAVAPDAVPALETEDLSGAAAPAEALRERTAAIQRGHDLAAGHVARATLFETTDGQRLLLTAHHLVVDAVSWRIVLEDLAAAYDRIRADDSDPFADAPAPSFLAWARAVHAKGIDAHRQHAATWAAIDEAPRPALPPPPDGTADTYAHVHTAEVSIDANGADALADGAQQVYGATVEDALLAALVQALNDWLGGTAETLLLEGHGREGLLPDRDCAGTVGWFTAFHPVRIDFAHRTDPGARLKETKESLRRLPPAAGYPVLRCLGPADARDRLARQPLPPVSFNYLGDLDALDATGHFRMADEPPGATVDPDAPVLQPLEIVAFRHGRRLRIRCSAPPAHATPEALDRLAEIPSRDQTGHDLRPGQPTMGRDLPRDRANGL